jgi:hypothetical protein
MLRAIGGIPRDRKWIMASTVTVTGAWRPKTTTERQAVLSQLEKILSDVRFTASKRYPGLLRYIVEQTLAQNEENLKERTLGVEVFHRPPNYDTNLDPVVRLCAAEVRKRLAQYYQSPLHEGELRIDLHPGSYIPLFSHAAAAGPRIDMLPQAVLAPRKQRRSLAVPAVAALLFLSILSAILAARYARSDARQGSALEEVWAPLFAGSKPILFCVGEKELTAIKDSPLAELQSGADDDSSLQPSAGMNGFVAFSDVQILSRFVSLAGNHGHPFRVQNSRMTVSSQLREGPVVLIGALNNTWTLNRTGSLRFHLEGPVGPDGIYWIADAQHPESQAWQVRAQAPRSDTVKDYGIAARFVDESTGQVVLVAAGIAGSGTRAAGEFLTDEASLKQVAKDTGAGWEKKNFEFVLSSQVAGGMQGKPKVEAIALW